MFHTYFLEGHFLYHPRNVVRCIVIYNIAQGLLGSHRVKLQGTDSFKYLDKFAVSGDTDLEITYKARVSKTFNGHEQEDFVVNLILLD